MSFDIAEAKVPHTKEIPFDPKISRYTRFLTSYEPHEYSGWVDESMSWKETCYIGDWSPLVKFHLQGPDALKFLQSLSGFAATPFEIGQAKHMVCANRNGKVIGEGILMRYGDEEFQYSGGPGVVWALYKWFTQPGAYNAVGVPTTDAKFVFQVQGPNSLYVLEKLVNENIRDIPFMHFRDVSLLGTQVSFLRQGMSGDIGFELQGPSAKGVDIYSAILEAGQGYGIRRLGALTKLVNHVEACYPTPTVDYAPAVFDSDDPELGGFVQFLGPQAGAMNQEHARKGGSIDSPDISALYFSPVELGWGRTLTFDHDFPGRAVLEEEVRHPKRLMRTLEWNSDDVKEVHDSFFEPGESYQYMYMPRELSENIVADKVQKNGKVVGTSTSRCYSYYFRKMLSLCTLDVDQCEPGTQVEVIWGDRGKRQKTIRATVAPAPYKTDKRRVDLTTLPRK